MRKTIKRIGTLTALAVGIIAFSACSKKDFISYISDTYAVQTQGSSDFFNKENGQVWDILDTKGSVKYYVYPNVPVIRYNEDATSSSGTDSYLRILKEQMSAYGYVNTTDESEADIMVCMSNFQLFYTNIIWLPSSMIDPYFLFWGGYYPWLYTPRPTPIRSLLKWSRPNRSGNTVTGTRIPGSRTIRVEILRETMCRKSFVL